MRRLLLVSLFVVGILWVPAQAEVPGMMTLQGRVVDSTGTPIDSTVDITFTLYSDQAGTSQIWQEVQPDVVVSNGRFDVLLGSVNPLSPVILNGSVRWLSLQVGGGPESDTLIPLTSTAYAQRASHTDTAAHAVHATRADTAAYATSVASNGWVDIGGVIHPETLTDSVGIGTDDPLSRLEVVAPLVSIIGRTEGDNFLSVGVYGYSNQGGTGTLGWSRDGRGIYGSSVNAFAGYFDGPKNYFSGNVGLGTTTPDEKLDIENATSGGKAMLELQATNASTWGEAGLRIGTPEGSWRLHMEETGGHGLENGSVGIYSEQLGEEVMTWTEEGRVGINKINPTSALEIWSAAGDVIRAIGSADATGVFSQSGTGYAMSGYSTGSAARFVSEEATGVYGKSTSGTGVYGTSSTGYGGYFTGPKHYFNGLLGLATTNPTHRLTVDGAIALQSGGDTKFHINYYNGGFNISETTVADYRLNIEAGGNVGIGTGTPQQKLHVAGNARIDGTLYTDGIEDNSIDKDDILDDAGVASSEAQGAYIVPTNLWALRSRAITTPADGYVLAIASFGFNAQHLATGVTSGIIGISITPDSLPVAQRYQIQIPAMADYGDYKMPGACQRVFELPAGTYTFYLLGQNTGDNFLTVGPVKLALLFVPTRYGTVTAAELAEGAGVAEEGRVSLTPVPPYRAVAPAETGLSDVLQELAALRDEVAALKSQVAAKP